MKNKILVILIGCLFVISCSEDFITRDFDKSKYEASTFYNNLDHAKQALNAAYSGLNAWGDGYTYDLGIMHFALGDDLYPTGFAAGFGSWGSTNSFYITPTAAEVGNTWNGYYIGILKCNVAIQAIPASWELSHQIDPNFTEAVRNTMMGQALFLRAFNYWNLFQYFPQDQLVLRRVPPTTEADYYWGPSPRDSIFNFIESDLKKAEEFLAGYTNTTAGYEKFRVTRGAVVALLGKLYMNEGMYAEAAAEFKKILPGEGDDAYGNYSLVPNYRDNFKRNTENNAESVFEIQMDNLTGQAGFFNNDVNWIFQNFTLNRTSWSVMWWNFAVPTFKLNEFESWTENIDGVDSTIYDYRAYATFWGVPGGANFTNQYGVVKDWKAQGWKNEVILAGQQGCLSMRKYAVDAANEGPAGLDPLWSDNNLRIIRLADIILRYAECLAQTSPSNLTPGDPNSAIYWVDMIRNRANAPMNDQAHLVSARPGVLGQLPSATALMTAKSWTLMQVIEHERYVEGYCEGWRKEDLKRWKKGADYVQFKSGWTGYESLTLPVPASIEIDRNPNYQ